MFSFQLVIEHGRVAAAFVPSSITEPQLRCLYAILPGMAFNQPALAARWKVHQVFASDSWAHEQLKGVPKLKPKTIGMALV